MVENGTNKDLLMHDSHPSMYTSCEAALITGKPSAIPLSLTNSPVPFLSVAITGKQAPTCGNMTLDRNDCSCENVALLRARYFRVLMPMRVAVARKRRLDTVARTQDIAVIAY